MELSERRANKQQKNAPDVRLLSTTQAATYLGVSRWTVSGILQLQGISQSCGSFEGDEGRVLTRPLPEMPYQVPPVLLRQVLQRDTDPSFDLTERTLS